VEAACGIADCSECTNYGAKEEVAIQQKLWRCFHPNRSLGTHESELSIKSKPICSLAEPRKNIMTFTYDNLGRLVTIVYFDGKTVTYMYDACGNRTSVVST
jgi:YD repeat-containing protein